MPIFGEQMKMPAPDIEKVLESHRKNLEAFPTDARKRQARARRDS